MATSPSAVWVSTRRMGFLSLVSPKRRSPAPSTTGKIFSRSWSTRSCSSSVRTRLEAAGDGDLPVELLLQLRGLVRRVALEHRRVVPVGIFEGRGDDVLGQAVQPVRQLASAGWPPRGEPLVAPPTQQQGLGVQRLVERELVEFWAILDQADPAAEPEALVTGWVLDDSVERDVLADHDLPFGFSFRWRCPLPPQPGGGRHASERNGAPGRDANTVQSNERNRRCPSNRPDRLLHLYSLSYSSWRRSHCSRVISYSTSPCSAPSTGAVLEVGNVRT